MRSQEGYIELDGEIVSVAAKKAFEVAKKHDGEVNKRVKEAEDKRLQDNAYRVSEQGIKDVKTALEKSKVLKSWEVEERGWFFTYTVRKEQECVDVNKFQDTLKTLNPIWDNFRWFNVFSTPTDLLKKSDEEIKDQISYQHMRHNLYRLSHWDYYSYSANYYEQFFDLKGKVLLTLEQYSKLKEHIED